MSGWMDGCGCRCVWMDVDGVDVDGDGVDGVG